MHVVTSFIHRDSSDKEPPSPKDIDEKLLSVRNEHQEKLDALRREQNKAEQDLVEKYRNIVSGGKKGVQEKGYCLLVLCTVRAYFR